MTAMLHQSVRARHEGPVGDVVGQVRAHIPRRNRETFRIEMHRLVINVGVGNVCARVHALVPVVEPAAWDLPTAVGSIPLLLGKVSSTKRKAPRWACPPSHI